MGFRDGPGLQRTCQDVCGNDSILDSVINSYAPDRRHRMRSVADDEDTRLVPKGAAAGFDGKQGELLPIRQRFSMFRKTRFGLDHAFANSFHALRAHQLILALRKDQASLPMIVAFKHDKNRSEEHTSELQSRGHLVCRLLLEKKK